MNPFSNGQTPYYAKASKGRPDRRYVSPIAAHFDRNKIPAISGTGD